MKIAATIAQTKSGWTCLDVGPNIDEQKKTLKKLVEKNGAGPVPVHILYTGGTPPKRKGVSIKGDIVKAYDIAKNGKPASAKRAG